MSARATVVATPNQRTPSPTLDEAIRQQVSLGANDPLEIVAKLDKAYGHEWVLEQLVPLASDIVADMARRALGEVRRAAEIVVRPGDVVSQADLKIAKVWVPTRDGFTVYKPFGKLTADDLDARAAWYENFAKGALRRAAWCREVSALMRAEGVALLGKLKAQLPELPAAADLPELS